MTQAGEEILTDDPVGAAQGGARRDRGQAAYPTAQALSLPDLHADVNRDALQSAGGDPVIRSWNPLHHIKARLQVIVGEASISVGELLEAKEHQVLRLDRAIDQPVDLTIEGKIVARGQLVAVDGNFAFRITELPVALDLKAGS